jgi:hypothetical protein
MLDSWAELPAAVLPFTEVNIVTNNRIQMKVDRIIRFISVTYSLDHRFVSSFSFYVFRFSLWSKCERCVKSGLMKRFPVRDVARAISVYAWPVPGETNIADNTFVDDVVETASFGGGIVAYMD